VMFREDVYDRDAAVLSALDDRNGPVRVLFPVPAKTQSAPSSAPPAQSQEAAIPKAEPEIRSKDPRQGALAAQ